MKKFLALICVVILLVATFGVAFADVKSKLSGTYESVQVNNNGSSMYSISFPGSASMNTYYNYVFTSDGEFDYLVVYNKSTNRYIAGSEVYKILVSDDGKYLFLEGTGYCAGLYIRK